MSEQQNNSAATRPEAVIAARNLTKRYGKSSVVDTINFDIAKGEVFGLLGPTGAGKTTTILMMLGLTEISAGRVSVLGFDPARQPWQVKRRVGYLPDAVGFYRNVPAPGLEAVVRDVCDDRFDAVLFSSPSTLERLLQTAVAPRSEVLAGLGRCRLVAMGPVTARAIEVAGLQAAGVATEPTDESVVQCIESCFR